MSSLDERANEQRANIKFCLLLDYTPQQIHEKLKTVYGEFAFTERRVCWWCEKLRGKPLDYTDYLKHDQIEHEEGDEEPDRINHIKLEVDIGEDQIE